MERKNVKAAKLLAATIISFERGVSSFFSRLSHKSTCE